MEETINLKEIYQTIRKRLLIIALITIAAVAISGIVSYFVLTPIYQSSTQILVNQERKKDVPDYNQVQTNVQMVNTYSVIIKSPAILSKVINNLNLNTTVEELTNKLTINSEQESQVFNVTVQDPDPAMAVKIANNIATTFKDEIPSIMKIDNVSILSKAELKENPSPVKPNPMMNMAIALVIGLMAGAGLAFLLEYLDNTLKTEQDIENFLELPVLGAIPKMTANDEKDAPYRSRAV
ncbi:YveK family protein [Fictibacillus terranigra]|uniref:Wzz/FepE/Etk N-terminal domain-containing protein n=1 Tax=Fictibacillus terranigra TaxID=3058424 RepID=A0ABT8E1I5_9BACL|nr:Wzz/FepE/Etk N-terminal domain-containing protein [Fictibacillus sp. CENA-BCM004]MDN4071757.1 Wzz/FepE/Etk N-terminal domain-containing protein [Fictibacillus sp. CENA-BCM004]